MLQHPGDNDVLPGVFFLDFVIRFQKLGHRCSVATVLRRVTSTALQPYSAAQRLRRTLEGRRQAGAYVRDSVIDKSTFVSPFVDMVMEPRGSSLSAVQQLWSRIALHHTL